MRVLVLLGVLLLVSAVQVQAQADSCLPNELGVNQVNTGTNFSISNAAATKVANKDLKRCQLLLINQGAASISCLAIWQGPPTSTKGVIIDAGKQLAQNTSGRGEWHCIATTATPSTLLVLEELPNAP